MGEKPIVVPPGQGRMVLFDLARLTINAFYRHRHSRLGGTPGAQTGILFGVLEDIERAFGAQPPAHAGILIGEFRSDEGVPSVDWGVQSACMPPDLEKDLARCTGVLRELGIPIMSGGEGGFSTLLAEALILARQRRIPVTVVTDRNTGVAEGAEVKVMAPLGAKPRDQHHGEPQIDMSDIHGAWDHGGRDQTPGMTFSALEYLPAPQEVVNRVFITAGLQGFIRYPLRVHADSASARSAASSCVDESSAEAFVGALRHAGRYALVAQAGEHAKGVELTFFDELDRVWHLRLADLRGGVGRAAADVLRRGDVFGMVFDLMAVGRLLSSVELPNGGIQVDVRIAEHLLAPETYEKNLEQSAARRQVPAFDPTGLAHGVPADSARTAFTVWQLAVRTLPCFAEEPLHSSLLKVEVPVAKILLEMEQHGIAVDDDVLAGLNQEMHGKLKELDAAIHQLPLVGDVDLNRRDEVEDLLFRKLKLSHTRRTRSGKSSLDREELEKLLGKHDVIPLLIERSELRSLVSSVTSYREHVKCPRGTSTRIFTSFDPVGTITGRISASSPNLMAVPGRTKWGRRLRAAFIPSPGYMMISADYAGIELRVLASLAQDEALLSVFRSGADVHAVTAKELFGDVLPAQEARNRAKELVFALLYGAGPTNLATRLGSTVQESKRYRAKWSGLHPHVSRLKDELLAKSRQGGSITTMFGRRLASPGPRRNERSTIFNYLIQSTAAEILKRAILRVDDGLKRGGYDARILLPVHDELVLEAAAAEADAVAGLVQETMESAVDLASGLVVSVKTGTTWAECR